MLYRQYQVCQKALRQLISDKSIPLKMQIKLRYLCCKIQGRQPLSYQVAQLPQVERQSIQSMNLKMMLEHFCNLIMCLTGKQVYHFSQQPALFKKQNSFSGWKKCLISFDSENFIVSKHKNPKQMLISFELKDMMVSKRYKQSKGQYIFGIVNNNTNYTFSFEIEQICVKIHKILLDIIEQKKQIKKRISLQQERIRNSISVNLQYEKDEIVEDNLNGQDQEYDFLINLIKHINEYTKIQKYHLIKNITNGRIMKDQQNKLLKASIFLQAQPQEIIHSYLMMNNWNNKVESIKLVNKLRHNVYLYNILFKKNGLFSSSKSTTIIVSFLKMCKCLDVPKQDYNKLFLIIQNSKNQKSSIQFEQIVEISKVQNKKILDIIHKISQNYNNSLSFLQNISNLNNFIQKNKQKQTHSHYGLDINYCLCKVNLSPLKRKDSDCLSIDIKVQMPPQPNIQNQSSNIDHLLNSKQLIQDLFQQKLNPQIIQFIDKQKHHSYSLKHLKSQLPKGSPIQDYLFQKLNWIIKSDQLIFANQSILSSQKGIIKIIAKQIGSNVMAGKSIMNMSLPVQIHSNISTLEAVAKQISLFPCYLHKASKTNNILEQIKLVTMSFMFLGSCFPTVEKPFNPILGQTFTCWIGGYQVYFQQISHHPPVTAMLIKNNQFQAYANFDIHVQLGLNSAYSKVSNFITVKILTTQTQYIMKIPDIQLGGIIFGDRCMRLAGKGFVFQTKNDTYCQISFGKAKKKIYQYAQKLKPNNIAGGIFKVTNSFGQKLKKIDKDKNYQGIKLDDIIQKYSQISGKWYSQIKFDNQVYKSLQNGPFPHSIQRSLYLLPSDSVFRKDIIYRKWGNYQKANEQKTKLQQIQRHDRKLRQKWQKK